MSINVKDATTITLGGKSVSEIKDINGNILWKASSITTNEYALDLSSMVTLGGTPYNYFIEGDYCYILWIINNKFYLSKTLISNTTQETTYQGPVDIPSDIPSTFTSYYKIMSFKYNNGYYTGMYKNNSGYPYYLKITLEPFSIEQTTSSVTASTDYYPSESLYYDTNGDVYSILRGYNNSGDYQIINKNCSSSFTKMTQSYVFDERVSCGGNVNGELKMVSQYKTYILDANTLSITNEVMSTWYCNCKYVNGIVYPMAGRNTSIYRLWSYDGSEFKDMNIDVSSKFYREDFAFYDTSRLYYGNYADSNNTFNLKIISV